MDECLDLRFSAFDSAAANEQQQRQLVAMLRDLKSQLSSVDEDSVHGGGGAGSKAGGARAGGAAGRGWLRGGQIGGSLRKFGSARQVNGSSFRGKSGGDGVGGRRGGGGGAGGGQDIAAMAHAKEMVKKICAEEEGMCAKCEVDAEKVMSELEESVRAVQEMEQAEVEDRQREQEERLGSLAAIKLEGSDTIMRDLYHAICELDEVRHQPKAKRL